MDHREARIALNMIEHVGPIRLRQLLEHLPDPVAILEAPLAVLRAIHGIGEETAQAIARWRESIDLAGELRRIERFGCRVLVPGDEEFPALLNEIYDPPIVLYIKGTLTARDRQSVAMVGSRQSTPYGIETSRRLSYQLAHAGVTVVSGGARGIDTAAHQGALAAKGRSVAVLGTGIDRVFPPENADLFERISGSGALLTQFPFGRPADRQTFPIRNRLVAGMTLGTVVVEANLASGALITAGFAIDYGRQVFAVPGRIDSPRSRGCHDLIKKGAKLCEGIDDILAEFEYLFPMGPRSLFRENTVAHLSEAEQRVYAAVRAEERSIDEIIRDAALAPGTVSAALFSLEMKKLIRQLPGRLYLRNTGEGPPGLQPRA